MTETAFDLSTSPTPITESRQNNFMEESAKEIVEEESENEHSLQKIEEESDSGEQLPSQQIIETEIYHTPREEPRSRAITLHELSKGSENFEAEEVIVEEEEERSSPIVEEK